MKNSNFILSILLSVILLSCEDRSISTEEILDKSIAAHGLDSLEGKDISFKFRDYGYSLKIHDGSREYRRIKISDSTTTVDVLHSRDGYYRTINDSLVVIADSMAVKYSNSVNSVLYFFQVPLVLKEPAVMAEYLGETIMNDQGYHTIGVSFRKEGGGKDFEDEFRYWINKETMEVDFLAYSYLTDGGGVRFREAFNKQRTEGILFQDYKNYKPDSRTTLLDSLPVLFRQGKLKLLSRIENTEIRIKESSDSI